MSVVSLLGVNILNNPARFTDNYQFEITFECLEQLEKGEKSPFSRLAPAYNPWPLLTTVSRSRVEADLRRLCYLVSLHHL